MNVEDIKYGALVLLGQLQCPDFSATDVNEVKEINRRWTGCLYYTLSRYPWSFATTATHLDNPIELTDNKYRYKHKLPNDFLYLQGQYYDKHQQNAIYDFWVNDDFIYTNTADIYIRYTKKISVEKMPIYFSDYVTVRLAFEICSALTGDTELENRLQSKEALLYIEAKNIDARQQAAKRFKSSPFIDVRG